MDLPHTFVALDFELAQADPRSICALGAVSVVHNQIAWETETLICPPQRRTTFTNIHGLRWEDLENAPSFRAVWPSLVSIVDSFPAWVAHNAAFERRVLRAACREWNLPRPRVQWFCTMSLAERRLGSNYRRLPAVCNNLGIALEHHDALSDARAAASIILALRTGATK